MAGLSGSPDLVVAVSMDYDAQSAISETADALLARARRFRGAGYTSLCVRCRHSHIYRLKHRNDPAILCQPMNRHVPHNIEECNQFEQIGTIGIWELARIAKVIDPSEPDKQVGIRP